MERFRLLALASASLLLLGSHEVYCSSPSLVRADCRAQINEIRGRAGLGLSTEPTGGELNLLYNASVDGHAEVLETVCNGVRSGAFKPDFMAADKFTMAYYLQNGNSLDCAAAVEYWKGAISNLQAIPPPYVRGKAPYDDPKNVSFISLFNPKDNPTIQCAFATCPASPKSPSNNSPKPSPSSKSNPILPPPSRPPSNSGSTSSPLANTPSTSAPTPSPSPRGSQSRRLSSSETLYGLICFTTPPALVKDNAPFTEAQWEKITAAVPTSATVAPSTLLAVVTAVLGAALF